MKTLYLIRGIPGSGKSTFASELSKSMNIPYFEADKYFDLFNIGKFEPMFLRNAHEWCQESVNETLANGNSVIVSNNSTTESEVEVYKYIAEYNNAKFISLIVENRHGNKSIHDIPDTTITKMKNRFSVKL